jgi:hypothetical protein
MKISVRNEYFDRVQIKENDTKTLAIHYKYEEFSYKDPNWKNIYYKNKTAVQKADMCY